VIFERKGKILGKASLGQLVAGSRGRMSQGARARTGLAPADPGTDYDWLLRDPLESFLTDCWISFPAISDAEGKIGTGDT
jgi:hypothetical protein